MSATRVLLEIVVERLVVAVVLVSVRVSVRVCIDDDCIGIFMITLLFSQQLVYVL
jgi:hypothetical protein